MSKVLLLSRDPGGANTVIPLVRRLGEAGHQVALYGKDIALEKYRQAGCPGVNLLDRVAQVTPQALVAFLREEGPDLVITGTSADDFAEKYLWAAAGELGIPSMAIMDHWANYGLRFSEHGVSGIDSYLEAPRHPYLPSRIIAMDDYARQEMIADGLPAEIIRVCGQPYFESLLAARSQDVTALNTSHGLEDSDFVVVFASEAITSTYGENAAHWGYTEKTVFASFVRALDFIAADSGRRVVLIIRPHPKENQEALCEIASRYPRLRWRVDTSSHPWALITRADLVCGMSSMFLIESVIMGRTTLSILIGLTGESPFVLDRRGNVKSIVTEAELLERLTQIIRGGERPASAFEVIHDPVTRIISEMEALLCHG